MTEALTSIPVRFDTEALLRAAHVEAGGEDAEVFQQLVALARDVARPKVLLGEAFVEERGQDTVRIGGVTFTSRMLRANLDQVQRVFPFVATCGHEMDQASLPADEFMAQYWWDEIKAAALGCALRHLHEYLKRTYLLGKSSGMSPGAGDVEVWPIQQQSELFSLLGDVKAQIGVELTPSFLMVPNKSVSGIQFATESDFLACQVCRREGCPSRSAAFDAELWKTVRTGG